MRKRLIGKRYYELEMRLQKERGLNVGIIEVLAVKRG